MKLQFLCLIFLFSCVSLDIVKSRLPGPQQTSAGSVIFRFDSPSARTVTIAGDFNGWEYRPDQSRTIRMKKVSDTLWEAEVKNLKPGRYQYKFVVDYQIWLLDPNNPYVVDDGTGNKNSLLIVK